MTTKWPKRHFDDDGNQTTDGCKIAFTYGIPTVRVIAEIEERDGKLFALTPDHIPKECRLDKLRSHVGSWYRIHPEPM